MCINTKSLHLVMWDLHTVKRKVRSTAGHNVYAETTQSYLSPCIQSPSIGLHTITRSLYRFISGSYQTLLIFTKSVQDQTIALHKVTKELRTRSTYIYSGSVVTNGLHMVTNRSLSDTMGLHTVTTGLHAATTKMNPSDARRQHTTTDTQGHTVKITPTRWFLSVSTPTRDI